MGAKGWSLTALQSPPGYTFLITATFDHIDAKLLLLFFEQNSLCIDQDAHTARSDREVRRRPEILRQAAHDTLRSKNGQNG